MRILVFDDKKPERDFIARALAEFRVETVATEAAALESISRESPQVILFAVPPKGGPDLARRLRSADKSGQAFISALLEPTSAGKEVAHLVASGVHDFTRRPILEADLVERVRAPLRLMEWVRSVNKPAAFDFSTKLDLTKLKAWGQLGPAVAADFGQMAGQSFSVDDGWPAAFKAGLSSATMPMSLAGDQLEARISIVVDQKTLAWVRANLLGDPDANQDATDDALRELTNTAGGAVKRTALAENVVLTTGLPVNDTKVAVPGNHKCWSIGLENDGGYFGLIAEVRRLENQKVSASQLTEGMVVAHDVRNEGGILLVPAGSRLTGTSAARLAKMLGEKFFIEVAPAA